MRKLKFDIVKCLDNLILYFFCFRFVIHYGEGLAGVNDLVQNFVPQEKEWMVLRKGNLWLHQPVVDCC